MRNFVILFGPPASGKDTVTATLARLDPRYALFPKLKTGRGRTLGYRTATSEELAALRSRQAVVQESQRYGNTYAVDREQLDAMLDDDLIPVVHVGDLTGVRALRSYPGRCLSVLLWCSRDVAVARLVERAAEDLSERLDAWDAATQEIEQGQRAGLFDISIDTGTSSVESSAHQIITTIQRGRAPDGNNRPSTLA